MLLVWKKTVDAVNAFYQWEARSYLEGQQKKS
jgi:hypothetical protein